MLKYLNTVRKEINVLVAISLLILLLKILWLNRIPAIFSFASEAGEVVDRLCASIISSYLFFMIVVHFKSEKDKESINPYVLIYVNRIVNECISQLNAFQKASNISLNLDDLTLELVKSVFAKIHPRNESPLIIGYGSPKADWLQFLAHSQFRTARMIEKLFIKITFLDPQLVRYLSDIDDCSHFNVIQSSATLPVSNATLEAWADSFFEYCLLISKLDKHAKKKLALYSLSK